MKNIKERAREYADRHKAAELEHFGVRNFPYGRIYNAEMAAYEKGATDQRAIEEEVTLKKYDFMTRKQLDREENFTSWYFQNVKGTPTYSDAIEWARKQTINEACELIEKALQKLTTYKDKDNFTENEFKIITASRIPNWLIKFRKEMEE